MPRLWSVSLRGRFTPAVVVVALWVLLRSLPTGFIVLGVQFSFLLKAAPHEQTKQEDRHYSSEFRLVGNIGHLFDPSSDA
jgi:hypothetical protein